MEEVEFEFADKLDNILEILEFVLELLVSIFTGA